ncbi:fused signal recognition particle receptor [Onishia taeanensis]|uniref:Signal recognition particle receptor FtsY n=1 Tax=Onishia taeanensis TaxID=284577 RepID=A0A1G7NY98_9GAMM|nr:signal recognition particle-docking protein FtsY [Halomonas taeanensis]SDF79012.1 fused signal recognition particle receptor [Halomonas taeanensis]
MFGFFKRKKKQDPAQQEPSSDQDVTPGAEESAEDDGSPTKADTAERPADAQPSQDYSSQAEAAEVRRETPAEQDSESAPRQDEAPEQTSDPRVEPNVEQTTEQAEDVSTESETAELDTEALNRGALGRETLEKGKADVDSSESDECAAAALAPEPAAETSAPETPSSEPEAAPDPRADDLDAQPQQAEEPQAAHPPETDASEKGSPEKDSPEKGKKKGWFARIKEGLGKTRANLSEGISDLFLGKKQIDDELMEDLETQLLMADVGIEATTEIIDRLTARVSRKELKEPQALYDALQEELAALLEPVAKDLVLPEKGQGPFVILMVGVNGVGKTTTIGKLAKRFQGQGRSVMLAAGDTFRAAAVEQLKVWGDRNSVPVIAQHTGADSASVIYDALSAAKARGVDVLIADTAGRLHNKGHLMEELKKVQRVMAKLDAAAPHEVMLVLDAGTGQNALSQAATFNEAVPVTGITLTKLDGTAKGGIIFALAKQLGTPIRYIGVGETVDDLRPFAGRDFVDALFNTSRSE